MSNKNFFGHAFVEKCEAFLLKEFSRGKLHKIPPGFVPLYLGGSSPSLGSAASGGPSKSFCYSFA